jgi:hypothetical protein
MYVKYSYSMYKKQANLAGAKIKVQCYNQPLCQHCSSKSYHNSKEITRTFN